MKLLVLLLGMMNVGFAFAGCLSTSQLNQLTEKETNYLSEKIPPAFRHALQANTVSLAVKAVDGEDCIATLVVKVPQADIDEASAVLEAQPAKKIMLAAQGYELPQKTVNEASFRVDATSLAIAHPDILQTAPFGKLRASLELMYAFISQNRADAVNAGQENKTPWPSTLTKHIVTSCSSKQSESVCTCMAAQYATKLTANEMEYIQYIRENPYALATGANNGFEIIKRNAEAVCKT